MTEPTDPAAPPEAGTRTNPLPAPAARPTPMQRAHTAYSRHATTCPRCRDVDRDRCQDGQQLWRAWNAACDEAYQQLVERTA